MEIFKKMLAINQELYRRDLKIFSEIENNNFYSAVIFHGNIFFSTNM